MALMEWGFSSCKAKLFIWNNSKVQVDKAAERAILQELKPSQWRMAMRWQAPKFEEVCAGMEINMYFPSEL